MRSYTMAAAVVLLSASRVPGQETPFSTPMGVAPEPFTQVAGIAELPDGRLVVVDRGEQRVSLVDLRLGITTVIGRTGGGPNEYLRPFNAGLLAGDTVFVYDAGNRRLFRIDPAGRPAGTLSLPDVVYAGHLVSTPRGTDAAGYLYLERVDTENRAGRPTIGSIARWRPGTTVVDSVASLLVGDRQGRKLLTPFVTRDGWAVGSAGLVIVRAAPYRVEWHATGSPVTSGAPIAFTPWPVTQAEIDAYWKASRARAGGARVEGGVSGGAAGGGAERARWEYPDALPPFDAREGVFVASSGDLWVVRRGRWNDPVQVVDVFDRGGSHVRTLRLPAHRRLVGFGKGVAYLVRVDEDDLQWLEQFRLPA